MPYYAIARTGYAHAPDAVIGAWIVWATLSRRGWPILGILLAVSVLFRLQNALWLFWLWPHVWHDTSASPSAGGRRADCRPASLASLRAPVLRCVGVAGLGLLGIAPQVYLAIAHPGSRHGSIRWTSSFFNFHNYAGDLLAVLAGEHGLLTYTPVAGLALAGLVWATRSPRHAAQAWAALAVLTANTLLCATTIDPNAGDAYGARRLVGCTVLWGLGLRYGLEALGSLRNSARRRRCGPRVAAQALLCISLVATSVNLYRVHLATTGIVSLRSSTSARQSGGDS